MAQTKKTVKMKLALLAFFLIYVGLTAFLATSFSQGPNNRNVSVDTTVNITDSFPEILSVIIEGGATNITLNAGTAKYVECNVSVRDYNGGATVLSANATFYANATAGPLSPDDNNTHYTNTSCAIGGTDGIFRNFTCTFPVQYYADVGFWICNATVIDDFNFVDDLSNFTHIDELLALNVTTLIDYGDLAVNDISSVQEANVTNVGNVDINVTTKGYGAVLDDGLAFVCDVGNISIIWEMYNITDNGQNPDQYINLSSTLTMIPGMTVIQQTAEDTQSLNTTYWLLEVPPNPFGICNGTVIFQAEKS